MNADRRSAIVSSFQKFRDVRFVIAGNDRRDADANRNTGLGQRFHRAKTHFGHRHIRLKRVGFFFGVKRDGKNDRNAFQLCQNIQVACDQRRFGDHADGHADFSADCQTLPRQFIMRLERKIRIRGKGKFQMGNFFTRPLQFFAQNFRRVRLYHYLGLKIRSAPEIEQFVIPARKTIRAAVHTAAIAIDDKAVAHARQLAFTDNAFGGVLLEYLKLGLLRRFSQKVRGIFEVGIWRVYNLSHKCNNNASVILKQGFCFITHPSLNQDSYPELLLTRKRSLWNELSKFFRGEKKKELFRFGGFDKGLPFYAASTQIAAAGQALVVKNYHFRFSHRR